MKYVNTPVDKIKVGDKIAIGNLEDASTVIEGEVTSITEQLGLIEGYTIVIDHILDYKVPTYGAVIENKRCISTVTKVVDINK